MKILMMVTADYAAVEPQTGKLNIIGVFNIIQAIRFPTSHPRMYLAVKFEREMSDGSDPYRLLVTLAGEDGQDLKAIEGSFEMLGGSLGIPAQHSLVVELNQLTFERPGEYRFYIRVNEGELLDESTVLQIVHTEA